jgi:HD-GYP domain-containing protein (c-di-GMP phosphodiesterase class II)
MPSTISPSCPVSGDSTSPEVKALAVVLRNEFDIPFRFYDTATGERLVMPAQGESASAVPRGERELVLSLGPEARPRVVAAQAGRYLIGFPLHGFGPSHLVAVGVLIALARTGSEMAQEQARLEKWVHSVHDRLRGASDLRDRRRSQAEHDRQSLIAWEAIMGLERLHRRLRTHKEPARNRGRILRVAGELLGAQALAWVSLQGDEDVVLEGERLLSPWDCGQLANLLAHQTLWEESGYVLINEVREASWAARFPQILNLLAIPVAEKTLSGWVLALNKRQAAPGRGSRGRELRPYPAVDSGRGGPAQLRPFRRSDAALLMPFASLLGLHVRAARRYLHIKDLLVGLTRSLTAAIDAKDSYTFGHSERVARAAVVLGRELGLQEDEQSDIYLAGLLHDIGKIGIRDDVLTKRGPLTEDESRHIQQHPVIGHRILAGLHAIAHLLPGVLYHHERYDGKGYPEGLRGDAIPLLARILSVADSFDAMNTSRPYRTAIPIERVDQILREGSGTQWDPLVIDAYVRCRESLVEIRQRGVGESLRDALDGALRNGTGRGDLASMELSIMS